MATIHLTVIGHLGPQNRFLQDIASMDSRLNIIDASPQFLAELRAKGKLDMRADRLEKEVLAENSEAFGSPTEDLAAILARTEILFARSLMPANLPARAPNLKWVHLANAGLDRYGNSGVFGSNIVLTNAKGAAAVSIAEHCMTVMFMFAKQSVRLLDNQRNHRWERFTTMELRGMVLAVVGLGAIGSEIARLAKCFGMRVLATRKSAVRQEADVCGVDRLYPISDLHELLKESDFVVVAAPLTSETAGMIGRAELQAMKPTAFLINIARGRIVQQATLITALKDGLIAGAGIDVHEVEPLPAESELWGMPNVILSSHNSGNSDKNIYRNQVIFQENLRRYLAGERLINVVDSKRGY